MAKPDGRVEAGQSLKRAISAQRWNDLCDAADIVHGRRGGILKAAQKSGNLLVGKTQSDWQVGESQNIRLYGPPLVEPSQGKPKELQELSGIVQAWNVLHFVPADEYVFLSKVGETWLLASARQETTLIGKPGAEWVKGETTFVYIWEQDELGGEFTLTNPTRYVTAYNPFAESVSGFVAVTLVNGFWYLTAAEC